MNGKLGKMVGRGGGGGGIKPRVAAHEYCLEWQLDEREKGSLGGSRVVVGDCCIVWNRSLMNG